MVGLFSYKKGLLGVLFLLVAYATPIFAEIQNISFSSHELDQVLLCSDQQSRAIEVSFSGKSYLTLFPSLAETPIINSSTVCRTFLSAWSEKLKKLPLSELTLTLKRDPERADSPVYRLDFPELLQACRELGYCMEDLFDYLSLNEELSYCQPKQTFWSVLSRMIPRSRRPSYIPIPKVTIEVFPFVPLVEKLNEYTRRAKSSVIATTMSLGKGTATKLFMDYKQSKKNILLVLDAGIAHVTGQGLMLGTYFSQHPAIQVLPMTPGHEYKTIFHWKLLVDPDSTTSLISSMNLSTPLKTPYVDLIYEFPENTQVKNSLLARTVDAIESQCTRKEDYLCLSEFSESVGHVRQRLEETFDRGCKRSAEFSRLSSGSHRKFFMEPQTDDLEYLTVDLIDNAKKEIVLFSHKFSLPKVYRALISAKKRGVSVFAFSSIEPHAVEPVENLFLYPSLLKERHIPEPHMKLLMIDRKTLLFGTGNFTYNAFNDARELFGLTHDPDAIGTVMKLASSFLHGYYPSQSTRFSARPTSQWVVGDIRKENTNERIQQLPHTASAPNDWMVHYREITPAGRQRLKQCKLDHLWLVPEFDYVECWR